MATLHIDFEGRSTLNLEDVGVDLWTRHHTTGVWCMAYAFDDEPPLLWTPKESAIDIFILESRPGVRLAAHNSQFEIAVWNHIMVPRYKWPRLDPSRLDCTMCMGYAMALPGKLDNLSAALGIQERKDMAGNRLAIQMSRPRAVDEFGCPEWWDDAERLGKLYDYCKQDVVVEREVHKRLLRLNPDEQKVWVVDHQINQRGMAVDIPAIQAALNVVDVEQSRLAKELDALTNGAVDFPSRVTALTNWAKSQLGENAYILEGLAKQEVIDLIALDWLPANVHRALEIRQEYAKTSVAKLRKMLESVSEDGRLKYILQYHAAGTGRWGGRRIQPQNMPRPKMKPEMIASMIDFMTRLTPQETIQRMELVYGAPMNMISECLRGMLRAAPGRVLLAGDYANIEGRGIAWLAGEEWKLQAFRDFDAGNGHDIYLLTAAKIYHTTPTAYTKSSPERQIGKVAELACGYQGGVGAFQTMAHTYGVKVPDEEAEMIKSMWREAHPKIQQFWWDLERAAMDAVAHPGLITSAGPRNIRFKVNGSFLWCLLPSGRALCYPYPCLKIRMTPWGEEKEQLHYKAVDDRTKQWTETHTYGGKLAENITQAISRDILAYSIMQIDAEQFCIVLHVHDEIVAEVPFFGHTDTAEQLNEFIRVMKIQPEWSAGLPIAIEGWAGVRYRK